MTNNPRRDDQAAIEHLIALAAALHRRGLVTGLKTPEGRIPSLRVINTDMPDLRELVVVDQGASGDWYLWSWARRTAPVRDVERAADSIAQALATDET